MDTQEQAIKEGEEAPIPGKARKAASAGYVTVYDTKTAEPSRINKIMLPRQLRKRREDDSLVFSLTPPAVELKRGKLKCLLHPSGPNREDYDQLGLAVCQKSNLTSPYQVTRHMMKRHKVEWGTIEQERIDAEKREDREFQRQLMGRALQEKAPLYVSTKKK